MPTVLKEVKSRAYKSAVKTCKIVASQHTSELGLLGAAMLAKEGTPTTEIGRRSLSL
jgi:hypothetical protein